MVFDAEDTRRDSPMRYLTVRGVSREHGKFGEHWKNGPRAARRIAVVAAASKGLMRAVAEELAREGTHVTICSREAKNLEQTAAEIKGLTMRKVLWRVVDVEQEKAIATFVADVEEEFGRVDICVTNSGGPPSHSFAETEPEVLLSNSARAAVTGLGRSLANEYAAFDIPVNSVCPGYTRTARLNTVAKSISTRSNVKPEEVFAGWARETPAGRMGRREGFAAVVALLASQRASYVNGMSIAVDGGLVRSLL
jgi:3-oxoacyl-[acyl-carrier protein] reductase